MISPFEGLSRLEKKLESHIYKFNKNEEIISTLKTNNIVCILLEGHAEIVNTNYLGEEVLIEELFEDSVFGTNISNIDDIECQIKALSNCTVLIIDYNKLINPKNLEHAYYNIFIYNLFQILNEKLKDTNDRVQILTKKNIRDKLLAFFENEYRKSSYPVIYLKTNFKDLADYLAINRSAMFRELRNLKDEKFIKVNGKRITLLNTPNINLLNL